MTVGDVWLTGHLSCIGASHPGERIARTSTGVCFVVWEYVHPFPLLISLNLNVATSTAPASGFFDRTLVCHHFLFYP